MMNARTLVALAGIMLPLVAHADATVFVYDIAEAAPIAKARAFLDRKGKCTLWIGSSRVRSEGRQLNPWVICVFAGTLAADTVNEQQGCIVGLYGLHTDRYREVAVESVMKERSACTRRVVRELLTKVRVDGKYPSIASNMASGAINGMGSVEQAPQLEIGGKNTLVSVAREVLADALSKSEKINWSYVCGKGKGELLGLRIDCSRLSVATSSERSGSAGLDLPAVDDRGQELLRQAQQHFEAGDLQRARRALKAAQELGWNDLDLAVALDRQ